MATMELHLEPDEKLVIRLDDDESHPTSVKQTLKKAQHLVRQHTINKSLVASLKKVRREKPDE